MTQPELPRRGAERFLQAAAQRALNCEPVQLSVHARTAALAAEALGCQVAQIANSLVFRGVGSGVPGGVPLLVMACGGRRVSLDVLAAVLGEPVAKADAAFVREHSGYAIGGVAPIGHAAPMRTLVDAQLFDFERVWAAAGSPDRVFAIAPDELLRVTGGEIARLRG